jgi:hypothetical protein
MKLAQCPLSAFAVLAAMAWDIRPAAAQNPGPPGLNYGYGPGRGIETITTTGPNGALIASGAFTFGIPYAASLVAATESSRPADNYLYAPIAGPWLDLANRGECPPTSACGNETAYKALLIADGVLQGVGALQILSGFLFPETHSVTTVADSSVHVRIVPQWGREGYGLKAVGTF